MKKLSIFTPCYNEEGNVYLMYSKVTEVMKTLPQYDYEYIFIDNCSTDKTPEILREIAAKDKRVKVIFNLRNFGPSRSGGYGFFQTTGDASICLACDFQDPPELIPEFVKKWEEGYKVVWGKKTGSAEKKSMFGIRVLYYKLVRFLAASDQYENVTGFGLYDKEVMDLMRAADDPNPNFRNLIGEYGYDIAFVEYYQPERKSGKSSYNFFSYLGIAITSIVTTSNSLLRIATYCGFAAAGLCFLVGFVYLILKLIFWNSFSMGLAPVVIGVFFVGAIQLIFIGILGEYINEILARLMHRPLVVEKERLNFDTDKNTEEVQAEEN